MGGVIEMVRSLEGLPCKCQELFEKCLAVQNQLDHAIFRHKDQWESAFSPEVAPLLASNACGRLWHTNEAKEEAVQARADSLGTLCVPMPDFLDGQEARVQFLILPPLS